jgi:hypothetical protein
MDRAENAFGRDAKNGPGVNQRGWTSTLQSRAIYEDGNVALQIAVAATASDNLRQRSIPLRSNAKFAIVAARPNEPLRC